MRAARAAARLSTQFTANMPFDPISLRAVYFRYGDRDDKANSDSSISGSRSRDAISAGNQGQPKRNAAGCG